MSKGLTRREFVKGTIAGTAALSFVGSPLFSAWAAEPVRRGGVWRYARNRTPPSMDAHRASETFSCIGAMYDSLVDVTLDPKTSEFKLVPGLATEWHAEKNYRRLIFTLRKGVLFHDGSSFDAAVAKWNIDRLRTHPKSFLAVDLKEIKSIDVINEQMIAINLEYPSAGLVYTLSAASGQAGFVSKSFQEKNGDDELARKGCGTGAFRCKTWIVDEKVVLERFPDYWKNGADGKALPYLDGIEEHYRPKIEQAVLDLRAGGLDTVHFPPPRTVSQIRENPDLLYIEMPPFELQDGTCWFNARRGPCASLELRRACCYGIDRIRFAKITGFGITRPHQYPFITTGQTGWSPKDWADYTYNPEKARELVKAAYPKGVTIHFSIIAREPDTTYGELIKAMWDAVGIKTELKATERLEWIENMKKDAFDVGMTQASTHPGGFLRTRLMTKSAGNFGNISDPRIDRLLDEHNGTPSEPKRHELMKEALKIVYDQAFHTCTTTLAQGVGTHKKVKGLRTNWRILVGSEVWLA